MKALCGVYVTSWTEGQNSQLQSLVLWTMNKYGLSVAVVQLSNRLELKVQLKVDILLHIEF